MRTTLRTILVPSLLVALIAAGCSGELTKDEYRDELTKVSTEAEARFQRLSALGTGEPDAKAIREEADAMRKTAEDFAAITPPAEVKDLHDDTVSVLEDLAELLDNMADIVEEADGDPSRLLQLLGESEDLGDDAEDIIERIAEVEQGYAEAGYEEAFQPFTPEGEPESTTATQPGEVQPAAPDDEE